MQTDARDRRTSDSAEPWQRVPLPVFLLTLIGTLVLLKAPSMVTTDVSQPDAVTHPAETDSAAENLLNLSIEELLEVNIAAVSNPSKGTMGNMPGLSIEEFLEVPVTIVTDYASRSASTIMKRLVGAAQSERVADSAG